ncbi:ZN507 protein, partial [Acromyrmex heyeri]
MDEYDKKFAEMQKYIPFLEAMIERLQNSVKDKDSQTREIQLQKMESLHGILSNSRRKLKIETLQRCEDVLQKLYNKVEKGNGSGLQLSFKQNDDVTSQPSTSSMKTKSNQCNEVISTNADNDKEGIEETPQSPDTIRSSSPDCQILPIIIPMERNAKLKNRNRRPQEQQRSKVIPVITLSDTKTITISSPDSNPDEVTFNEWDMLEESERQNSRNNGNRQSSLPVATSHDVTTAAKLISNNLPQKVSDNRNYMLDPQDIPTVPVPSLGGSRRLSSVLEKNKLTLDIMASCSRSESPVNVPEVRLNSPDPEILFAKPKPTSPRSNDSTLKPPPSKPPSIPLLFSPPPLSHEPLLSMEDLAELLNDEGDGDKTNENVKEKNTDQISKNSVLEKEKLTSRKSLQNTAGVSPVKITSSIGPPRQSNDSHRSVPQALFSKFQEPRYADNYERHPRQRDIHSHESAKDKLITISEETPSQITVIHNTASKSDERNVSLYQRRSSVPPEGRKDASLPRPENEFVIGNDYYNMHANQIHWSSPTTTSDQFGNNQWTPSSYGGMTNSPLQPTQHPFQRPMEPQFRQNQFPPTLSAGPRPLINPTVRPDMSHVIRSENVREDISPLMPPGFSSQYRGFQINQGSYDPAFPVGGPTEYPHIRPTWESSANPSYENVIPCGIPVVESTTGTSHPRPNTPCPWGTTARDRDRSNINQSRYYERNRIELRPGFNRDGRRSDWSWDGHSDRENLNRFPSRDPRVRTEHNTTGARDQAKETGVSARDPRLSKDKHVNTSTKTKDSVLNERDPRKRLVTASAKTMPVTKEKQKSQKSLEKEKDKLPKDRMQSPLESLYGVIDTKASQNSGLQKFKIPKIKRSEPAQLNRIINDTKEIESASSKLSRAKSNKNKEQKKSNKLYSKNKSKDVESAEVSSSSDGNRTTENLVQQNNVTKEEKSLSSSLEKSDKNETRIGEADSATNNSKSNHITKKGKTKESEMDGSKSKETVTKEWIEALIKESFESGEGKKLVEHAKLLQKFGEVLKAKNFKKIKKIIESESESNSDKDETIEAKKTQVKKKRRVIMSDSSDDECLAERLSILSTNIDTNDARELVSAISTDPKNSEENLEVTASSNNLNKKLTEDITAKKNDDLSESRDKEYSQVNNKVDNKNKDEQLEKKSDKNDRLENDNENTDIQSEIEKQSSRLKDNDKEKKQTKDNQIDQSTLEKSKDSTEGSREYLNQDDTESNIEHFDQDKDSTTQSIIFDITNQSEEVSIDKPKIKTKRRNSLEMLQEDIREMFISEGVVTATGHRMCRLSNFKKEETSNIAEKKITESNTETNESAANNAKRKSLRSRNVEESKSKAKSKDAKRMTRSLQSKKSIQNSDSEEDQPLALRTEKLLNTTDNSTSNQEVARSEESNDAIRRSKRVLRKDIIKEPRVVVEKADLTKIDSCKIMFDSSSDESFGIDVSELTAAVDISLRPEKQSDQDSIDTMIISSRRKNTNNIGKRNFKSKKSSALTDDKSEDGSSFTDEESVISDISMSSNTTARKKMNSSGAARTTAREELLSNILVGLVPTAKKNTSVDKDNEVDFEEDANDPIAIEPNVKRSCIKKKKKKSGNLWKMGRLTTKKRKKKTASAASSKTQTNVEINTESNISADTVEANQSLLKDPVTEKTLEKVLDDNHVVDHAKVDSVEDEVKSFVNIDSFDVGFKDSSNFTTLSEPSDTHRETLNDSFLSIEESKSLVLDIKEEVSSSSADLISANAVTGNKFFKESPKIVYDELMTELYHRIDIKHLIDYAWVGQDKYKCLLCFFTGKNIVYHYKINHPGMEVLISRLKSTDAKTAIMEAEHSVTTMDTSQSCKFRCRFCCFVTEGAADVALEAFYEHCTTHTGEYRFHCNNCSYQAVAKASMKTHYYKICRKNKTFNESASEDVVPREGGIYGYLCCSCNYVQLKRQNIEAHVEFWHREQMNTEILKINMSAITVLAEHAANNNEQSHESTSVNAEESFAVETKPQVLEFEAIECKDLMDIARIMESESNDNNTSECIPSEQKPNENIQVKEEKTEEIPKLSQGEPEGSVSTGNLSVFVCPPDLENKEMEIQRERQKTMQEIANNIGILLKNYSKPGLSIIDKLQDKMRTDAVVSPVPECNASANISETKENPSLPFVNSSAEPLKTEEELIIKEDIPSQSSNQGDSLSFMEEQLATEKSKATNDVDGKTDVKIRDPLVIMDPSKDNESDGENSDNERSAPIFESDSSSEQSDSEQTDVNMILKETSSINASSSRDPMLTTIQRLAAQLQNVKPLKPVPPEPMIDIKTEIKIESVEPLIPKPPDVVPIASVKHLLKQNVKCLEKNMPASSKNASPPKNFLRFRRLSGDMLSMPMQFLDNQEDSQGFNTDGTQSDSAIDGLKMDTEEECSFLKIENVRSLAESDPNESVTVNDTGKAVEISPTKNKESVLKKSNQPLILKKISPQALVNMNLQTPKMQSVTAPLTSSSTSPSTLNYRARKIKVIRMPVLNNTKDTSPASFAIKLKSMEVYARMLTEPKLAHFYKCMSHNCSFTTDFLLDYSKHYTKHYEEASEQNSTDNYDKCAYCYISTNNWNEMKTHLASKHLHCRYQCGYCFYRSFVPSYVRQHQIMCHPNTVFYYLLDKKQKLVQKKELVNRNAYVLPFICKQDDCDKIFYIPEAFITHLKTKHSSSHLVYKCHVCNTTHTKIELLISHYKLHGFCKYQCLYCFYGSDTLNEIHQHLSTFHYDRLPQVLERSLPPMPSRQVEVIHQLILRTFDDNIDEESVNLNTDNSKKNTSVLSNVGKTLNEAQSNQLKNLKGDILIGAVNDLKNTEVNVSNISTKQSTGDMSFTNINKNTNNSVEKQLLKNELFQSETGKLSDYTINQILQESKLDMPMNDSGAVDSLKISDEFNCSDEFVNTNLLDNADFLKNFTSNFGNMFSKSADKTEDSDIEILESEEKAAQCKAENEVKKKAELMSETEVENKAQVASSDTTETKCTSKKAPVHTTNATAQSDKPLTLDDIKDTGRIGHELYKCGYLHECSFTAQNMDLLKAHVKTCNLGDPRQNLFCPHCKKRAVKISLFLEHIKTHGLKRFGCSLCKLRYSVSYQATAHMKSKHKFFHTRIVPADPTNPAKDGLFIVQAVPYEAADRRNKKRKRANKSGTEQENEKSLDNEKLSFSPDEIEQLPRQAIYNREVQCAVCPYTTKVRTNIIRHLQLHAKDETVPESGPVNPVPCLDKKEKMFDKMVNLASSSHQNGRMGAKPKESIKESEADDSIPKFVPEHKRYVCGVAECNYLTVNEAMLKYHLKALHSEEPYFHCPHCPPPSSGQDNQNIAIDKMGIHLRMHDTRLYKCSHCNHHHYHRHVVERHLTDKHPEKRPFVKVIREMENTENVQQSVPEETEEEVPDPDGNHWKCNLCDFKFVYKADVATHADTVHGESSQYKCTLCPFKTSGKILLEQHINSKHTYDSNADYTTIYQRIKGVNKRNTETVDQGGQEEPFDTTPLWSRNMPRVRHIRGILLEEETETPVTNEMSPVTSKLSLGKRKSDAEIVMKPAKIKVSGKSISLDENNKLSKEKSKRSLSCDKVSGEAEGEGHIMKESAQSKVTGNKSAKDSMELIDGNDSDVGRFGPYGKPDANMYVCTLCNQFKSKYKHDMRDHLYRELNYVRFHCKTCGYVSVNRKALLLHIGKRHNGEGTDEPLSPDNAIEDWVMTLLKKQTDMIKAWNHMNVIYKNIPVNASSSSSDVSSIKISADKKSVNLASTISNLQKDVLEDINKSTIDSDDGDSRDNEDLVIDMKEDEVYEVKSNEDKSENDKLREKTDDDLDKPIVCKHCQTSFAGQRGFKLHVQYSHLKRLGFLCPYCDRSTNSQTMMRQHIRAKHPHDPERIIHNPDAWGNTKLSNEFWEKEYGLPPLKTKKRKLNTENNVSTTAASATTISSVSNRLEKCEVCNFTAVNYTGLRSHMRTHSHQHNLKCLYCTYSCSYKAEMVEHWESNHPSVPLKYTERLSATDSSSSKTKTKLPTPQKQDVDTLKNEEGNSSSAVIYGCVYCNLRSVSLPSIKQHWNLMHKDLKGSETSFAAKFPFKFKEIRVSRLSKNPTKKDVIERNQAKQTENLLPVIIPKRGWICQWCQELCETNNDRIRHHNMFHSHLPQKWKEQQQQQQKEQAQADTSIRLPAYSTEKYATNSKNLSSFESVVENLITKHVNQIEPGDMKNKNDQNCNLNTSTSKGNSHQAVARKSTTKSAISCARPGPRVFKAVARKSTNPRYPPNFFKPLLEEHSTDVEYEEEEIQNKQFVSHYGIPSSPVNLTELNTYMVVGGHSMRVNCLTLATLINIKPKILVKDIRKDPKYTAILSNLN